ncbi:NUDIX hydrolase [Serratia liquefaciens]|jgi:8-oxo-dGTP diphosphatase|uniref:NUDIX hydrolase n=1 Tax=Serratia TaxID=613 RepID=UPI0011F21BDB|nr:NUDIX hydrolase [Serratia liquefaciens]QIC86141.1 NUDIX domain-containing protein [Serratia liquefaciens]CAI1591807.1 mutator mutT protein [Serratia liquefaciens]
MTDKHFGGAKIALLCGNSVLTYQRDDKPDIPWPGCWDLPGGGRENDETPLQCVQRETQEEFGLRIAAGQVLHQQRYEGIFAGYPPTWFMLGEITPQQIAAIRFGDEGQRWQMMTLDRFIHHPQGISHLQQRLAEHLQR